ncbi:PREDICTED: rhamnosyl O-methyltransferase-like isoform X1 [Acropora digitifera]|uniref:rhamnosyl O-methyltransferase-like isoform X1 n=1 Tax=Acropora digitifera TaxID=70779 RepID=UPI00077B26B8|nr:PREDICTED: rhamnosyl O-methyltransferase-like isoform X1 [Acropora digitifera]
MDNSDYHSFRDKASKVLKNKVRFAPIEERKDTGELSCEAICSLSHGKWQTCWRGVDMLKDPLDLVIVQHLLWELKPQTVVELGAYKGGSALWTADMLKMFGCKSRVISVDIDLSLLDPEAKKSPDVEFIEGDIMQVEKLFPEEFLKTLVHPWFVVEDAHVNLKGVLEYFDPFTQPGDYICVEDTNPIVPAVVGQGLIKELGYVAFGPQKLNELKSFLIGRSQRYLVDQRYTDFFGYNATWNMNGFLKRV